MDVRQHGDHDAVAALGACETVSYEGLFVAHFPGMVRLAALLGADDAENVAQEAFVRLHPQLPRLTGDGAARAYLRTTVVNLTRKRHRHLRVVRDKDRPVRESFGPSAEEAALRQQPDAALVRALHALPPRQREAVVLRYWLDLSESGTADAMNVTTGSVKAHLSRGLNALRGHLSSSGTEPS